AKGARLFFARGPTRGPREQPEVPAGTDTAALKALVARELRRLETLQLTLSARDQADQRMAVKGVPMHQDAVTRRLKQNAARARARLAWATEQWNRLKNPQAAAGAGTPDTDADTRKAPAPAPAPAPAVKPAPVPPPALPPEPPPQEDPKDDGMLRAALD